MGWREKLESARDRAARAGDVYSEKAGALMEQHWSQVRKLWCEKIDPSVRSTLADDERLRNSLRVIHDALPLPIRLAIKEETFIRLCMNNRDRWMPRESGQDRDKKNDPPDSA